MIELVEVLTDLYNSNRVREHFERACRLVEPIMKKRGWRVPLVREFTPKNPNLHGWNVNGGQLIELRARNQAKVEEHRRMKRDKVPEPSQQKVNSMTALVQRDSMDEYGFYHYEHILMTLLHELAHNEVSAHNAAFYALLDTLKKEAEGLIAKGFSSGRIGTDGVAGRPLAALSDDEGFRLGTDGRVKPQTLDEARNRAIVAAEKRAQMARVMGGGGRLGGGDPSALGDDVDDWRRMSPAEAAARAAERRLEDDKRCGIGVRSESEVNSNGSNGNDDDVQVMVSSKKNQNKKKYDDDDNEDDDDDSLIVAKKRKFTSSSSSSSSTIVFDNHYISPEDQKVIDEILREQQQQQQPIITSTTKSTSDPNTQDLELIAKIMEEEEEELERRRLEEDATSRAFIERMLRDEQNSFAGGAAQYIPFQSSPPPSPPPLSTTTTTTSTTSSSSSSSSLLSSTTTSSTTTSSSFSSFKSTKPKLPLTGQHYTCKICFDDEVDLVDAFMVDACSHTYCNDCVRNWIKIKIDERATSVPCPSPECKETLSDYELRSVLEDDRELLQKCDRWLVSEALEGDENVRFCPKCSTPMIGQSDGPSATFMRCPNFENCKEAICFACNTEWHSDTDCAGYQKWLKENDTASHKFKSWAEKNAKQCPAGCGAVIQKTAGCNFMNCSSCKKPFCWACLKVLGSDHQPHSCKKYS